MIRIQVLKNKSLLAEKCIVADHFWARLKGLIGTTRLELGEGLWLSPCHDIHMWFMRIAIDVVFVRPSQGDALWEVTSVHRNLRPWKLFPVWDRRAQATLELPVGTIDRCAIVAGDELCIS
ncbi:DUF192 domain-containing protein [Bdellovibrionota bacterium FG-1]